jgi:catechol 2,3-dioxygenase-like lactoylglutathione lyase family enzyme|tara:strand:+ start:216 stop:590 length:375 start_codon:yes stop_codon:yes gene_type:complete
MNLNQVTITASNLKKSSLFYKKLGLKLIVDALPRYARFECPEGNSTFSIHLGDVQISNNVCLYFEVASLEKTVNELMKKGIVFETHPEEKTWLWKEASLFDPDGHKIIIYHAGENRLNPPWKIS